MFTNYSSSTSVYDTNTCIHMCVLYIALYRFEIHFAFYWAISLIIKQKHHPRILCSLSNCLLYISYVNSIVGVCSSTRSTDSKSLLAQWTSS